MLRSLVRAGRLKLPHLATLVIKSCISDETKYELDYLLNSEGFLPRYFWKVLFI